MPAHDLVVGDGRTFWFVYPAVREHSRKIAAFRDWLQDEAGADLHAARGFLRTLRIVETSAP